MKLYTEEQVRQAMDFARGHHRMSDTQFIGTLTPIELPSDAEIEDKVNYNYDIHIESDADFFNGAQWMRDKIQGK